MFFSVLPNQTCHPSSVRLLTEQNAPASRRQPSLHPKVFVLIHMKNTRPDQTVLVALVSNEFSYGLTVQKNLDKKKTLFS